MSSIQERLQLKRVPLDTWNIREQLCLASAVVRSGDQNWMSVSRALKTVGEPNRPPDWYSQKSCAAQYGALLEHVETPKRKKRSSEGAVETPQESILKRLTQERIVEIQKNVAEMSQQYELLRDEINEVRSVATSETRLRDLWAGVEAAKRAREREHARRAHWLKERDEKRAKAERTWRPSGTGAAAPVAPSPTPAPSSPLLTSLLKSSPVVTTPQHISHPANVVVTETLSPSAGAPTLSMLLEHNNKQQDNKQADNKHIAIENIKSQLVQIELQLKAGPPAVDIDDIEIKAEDVYAFRDVDIHIPPVAAMHKHNPRTEKPTFSKKEEIESTPAPVELPEEKVEEEAAEEKRTEQKEEREIVKETIGFPEVKFPTAEIKVIQPDEQKVKEEVKEAEVTSEVEIEKAEVVAEEETVEIEQPAVVEDVPELQVEPVEEEEAVVEKELKQVKEEVEEECTETEPVEAPVEAPVVETAAAEIPEEPLQEPTEELQVKEEEIEKGKEDVVEKEMEVQEQTEAESDKKTEDVEEALPLKEMIKEESDKIKEEVGDTEETHTETDDDTPMEVIREEDKLGRKRRDYSRKRTSRPASGSESAPDSPGHASQKHARLWKKSIMYVYTRLAAHKYAPLFLKPITDEEAPGYSTAIKRPMDLTTIKKLIENGTVRSTVEFQRLILLMLSNALMYNSSDHSVYRMAKELHEEASVQVGMLVAAAAVAGVADTQPRRKRSKHAPAHAHAAKRAQH